MVYEQKPGPSASTFSFRDITETCQSGEKKKVQKPTSQKESSEGGNQIYTFFVPLRYCTVLGAKWIFIKYLTTKSAVSKLLCNL